MKEKSEKEKLPIRVFREELGITRSELARKIKISERSLADIELGKSTPKVETAIALARVYKKSLKQVLSAMKLDVSGVPDDVPEEVSVKGK